MVSLPPLHPRPGSSQVPPSAEPILLKPAPLLTSKLRPDGTPNSASMDFVLPSTPRTRRGCHHVVSNPQMTRSGRSRKLEDANPWVRPSPPGRRIEKFLMFSKKRFLRTYTKSECESKDGCGVEPRCEDIKSNVCRKPTASSCRAWSNLSPRGMGGACTCPNRCFGAHSTGQVPKETHEPPVDVGSMLGELAVGQKQKRQTMNLLMGGMSLAPLSSSFTGGCLSANAECGVVEDNLASIPITTPGAQDIHAARSDATASPTRRSLGADLFGNRQRPSKDVAQSPSKRPSKDIVRDGTSDSCGRPRSSELVNDAVEASFIGPTRGDTDSITLPGQGASRKSADSVVGGRQERALLSSMRSAVAAGAAADADAVSRAQSKEALSSAVNPVDDDGGLPPIAASQPVAEQVAPEAKATSGSTDAPARCAPQRSKTCPEMGKSSPRKRSAESGSSPRRTSGGSSPTRTRRKRKFVGEPVRKDKVYFSEMELAIIRNYFIMHDEDGSGALSQAELMTIIDDMGRMPKDPSFEYDMLLRLWKKHDADESGELDFDEFSDLLVEYYQEVYKNLFSSYDSDGSGAISILELKELVAELKRLGFETTLDTVELITLVDKDGDGVLDFNEFCDFMRVYRTEEFKHLQKTAGFDAARVQWLRNLFDSYDQDNSGTLDIREVAQLFDKGLLGQPLVDVDRLIVLFARIDSDRSATLDFEEFLRLLRVWSKDNDRDLIDEAKGSTRVSTLGVRRNSAEEVRRMEFRQAIVKKSEQYLGVALDIDQKMQVAEDLYNEVLAEEMENQLLSKEWLLPLIEVKALRQSFHLCDADASGSIDKSELSLLLSNVGFQPNTTFQMRILEEVINELGITDDVPLDFRSSLHLVLSYHKCLASGVFKRMAEEIVDDDESDSDFEMETEVPEKVPVRGIPVKKIILALYQVGQYVSRARVVELLAEVGAGSMNDVELVGEECFASMLEIHRSKCLMNWGMTSGFKSADIEYVRETCSSHSILQDGRVEMQRIDKVLEELGYTKENNIKPEQLMYALARIDRQSTGSVPFEEFLHLLRHLENQKQLQSNKMLNELWKPPFNFNEDLIKLIRSAFFNTKSDMKSRGLLGLDKVKLLFSELGVAKTQETRKSLRLALEEFSADFMMPSNIFFRILKAQMRN